MKAIKLRRVLRLIGLFVLFTFLLLELTTRFLWWGKPTITILGRDVTLLPAPLLTEEQKQILDRWNKEDDPFLQFDPVLGWSIRPGASSEFGEIAYTSNNIGVRALREYDENKPDNVIRIAAFGPSFTFSQEVSDDAAWPTLLEQSRPDLEVMNWGVGAYGTDQSFLRYKTQGALYHPDVVLIGYEEDNIWRNVNRYRPYYNRLTLAPLTKPVYMIQQDQLVLLQNPFDNFADFYHTVLDAPNEFVDQTCPNDFFCNEAMRRHHVLDIFTSFRYFRTLVFGASNRTPLNTDSQLDPQETTIRLIEMFVKEVVDQQSAPVVILFPQSSATLSDYEDGTPVNYQEMLPTLQDRIGVQIIDLAPTFLEVKQGQHLEFQDFFTGPAGHYSELGNRIVADTVLQELCRSDLLDC